MADIVERLRAYAKTVTTHPPRQGFLNEAADDYAVALLIWDGEL